MNCLQNLPRSSAAPLQSISSYRRNTTLCSVNKLGMIKSTDLHPPRLVVKAISESKSSPEMKDEERMDGKSEIYSHNMTEAMGAVLTYRHELGMNYNFIRPDLIVGSCLQTPEDVDKLRKIGVKTIFCLQQDPDLEYFGVDISAIREYAKTRGDIQHLRAPIRDFDAFDLRMRLPAVVSKLHKAVNQNGGITYVHCTAGLGRAPAAAMAYMFWVQGYKLRNAHDLLLSKRSCFPKMDAIRNATADILTGLKTKPVTLTLKDAGWATVEISGLDVGWGQRIPLKFDKGRGLWNLKRELPEGRYEYKYIIDGKWTYCKSAPLTVPNQDGHVNNYIHVEADDQGGADAAVRKRLTSEENPDLTREERMKIRLFLESCPDGED